MNLRSWRESKDVRTISTGDGDGFITVRKGDTVIVVVARSYEDGSAQLIKFLNPQETDEPQR